MKKGPNLQQQITEAQQLLSKQGMRTVGLDYWNELLKLVGLKEERADDWARLPVTEVIAAVARTKTEGDLSTTMMEMLQEFRFRNNSASLLISPGTEAGGYSISVIVEPSFERAERSLPFNEMFHPVFGPVTLPVTARAEKKPSFVVLDRADGYSVANAVDNLKRVLPRKRPANADQQKSG